MEKKYCTIFCSSNVNSICKRWNIQIMNKFEPERNVNQRTYERRFIMLLQLELLHVVDPTSSAEDGGALITAFTYACKYVTQRTQTHIFTKNSQLWPPIVSTSSWGYHYVRTRFREVRENGMLCANISFTFIMEDILTCVSYHHSVEGKSTYRHTHTHWECNGHTCQRAAQFYTHHSGRIM